MGESIVETPNIENKTRGSVASGVALEVSVSFAQKKAYFEAHYKKIAARKAEQLELEKQMETNNSMKDDQNSQEHVRNASLTETELGIASGLRSVQVEQATNSLGVSSSSHSDESIENAAINIECQSSLTDGAKEEMDSIQDSLELNKSEEAVLVQEDTHLNGFAGKVDLPSVSVKEATHLNGSRDKVDMESPINLKKGTGNTMENRKEKQEIGRVKQITKDDSIQNREKLGRNKEETHIAFTQKNSRVFHSENIKTDVIQQCDSLIMEKMGDKDIVKRAFKTFQNNFNQVRASGDEKSSGRKEVPITRPEPKSSTSLTTRKENEGIRKAPEKMDAKRAQLGRSWNTTSTGYDVFEFVPFERLLQGVGMDQRSAKPAPSFGLRRGERAEPRKDFSKKSEEKSFAEETEKNIP
ncbi:hypothetical protein Acr_06g0003090 [Actinidia rufa]|uniref:Uncharacterized protein n=1 Tax=Actinidia rufa TaxID=165716 RepID=A0A7J0EQT3_9ERIC|nr:hypothetical protein Acr_06g0003090 [Actinidia rufa]